MKSYRIFQAWRNNKLFYEASEWLQTIENSEWNWHYGKSTINGIEYPAAVNIASDEDYMFFKLKFGDLLA